MNNQTVLVTGGTGFVGIHTILQLLQQGYTVKTTIRTLSKTQIIIDALKEAGLAEIRIEQFKGSVINLIIDTVLQIIKI